VTTQVLQPSRWIDTIDAIGTAHAKESVTMTAKVSETVQRVHFESGDLVHAGQVLVTLSDASNVAGVDAASANYRNAQQQFDRQQGLVARQLVAASTLDTLRAARDAAKAQLDQARTAVSDRVITAPFDGVLGLRQVSPGSLVTPGTVIATLDDVSVIKLDFSVPERELTALAKGQAVIARSDAYPDKAFDGTIASLDSRVDPVTRAITVQAQIANPERKLRPGMLLDVAVQQPARQTLQVPELALQQVGQQAFLFRVGADGKVEQVPVTIGARRPGAVEIVGGVRAGDRVVVEGTVKLHPGSKIVEAGAQSPMQD
jgi:membrane fusion protein (multidrug efflux system)